VACGGIHCAVERSPGGGQVLAPVPPQAGI